MQSTSATMAMVDYKTQEWEKYSYGEMEEYSRLRFTEPLVTADVKAVTENLGTNLEGLEYAVKTASSVEDKLDRKREDWDIERPFTPAKEIRQMPDVIRYTELCRHQDIIPVTKKTVEEMQKKGYVLSGLTNFYARPFKRTGYMGMHLRFISPGGSPVELQVHSPESFAAKQEGHALYEKIRSVSTPEAEKERLSVLIREVHGRVERPEGYKDLKSFAMQPREVKKLMEERKHEVDVDIQTKRDFPGVMVYTVSVKAEPVLHGCEMHFSDDSLWSYKNDLQKGKAALHVIGHDGKEIAGYDSKQKTFTVSHAAKMREDQEVNHASWMEEHFPDGYSLDEAMETELEKNVAYLPKGPDAR